MLKCEVKYEELSIGCESSDLHDCIQIAIANIPVSYSDIEASFLGKPNLSRDRLKPFTNLLNEISKYRDKSKKRIDLVVFPEVSVPHDWESMLVAWARRHRIGVVCGLEHRINSKKLAMNEVLAALPYQTSAGHWTCMPVRRLKRFYSPEEQFILTNEGLKVPTQKGPYHLFRWRGSSFAIYNCYELASIEDRALFKGRVDFIVGTEFNRDVNYFSNIVEAAARDLHCYVVQVNDACYGDSRVVSPSKSDTMNPLRIKGGDNLTYLTMSLNLKALRTHQRKGYGLQKESKEFKPTPPGFPVRGLQDRIKLGK
jgi:predicted amidohydrolase